jgi:hypothetical protein
MKCLLKREARKRMLFFIGAKMDLFRDLEKTS